MTREGAPKSYDRVTVFGLDWNGSLEPLVNRALVEQRNDPNNYIALGDGIRDVTNAEIRSKLMDKIGPNTLIQLCSHGDAELTDQLDVALGRQKSKHTINFEGSKWISTAGVIKLLAENSNGQSLKIILSACHGGAANECVGYAPKGSGMITMGASSDETFGNSFLFSDPKLPIQDIFLNGLAKCSQITTLSIKRIDGNVVHYKYEPFGGKVIASVDAAKRLIKIEQKKFIDWCESNKISLTEESKQIQQIPIQKDALKPILGDWTRFLMRNDRLTETDVNVLRELVRHDIKTSDGYPLLYSAAYNYTPQAFKMMMEAGADINAKTTSGATILYQIILDNDKDEKRFKLLLDANADINSKMANGIPILFQAILDKRVDAILTLITFGADTSLVYDGRTPLQLAEEVGIGASVRKKLLDQLQEAKNTGVQKEIANARKVFLAWAHSDPEKRREAAQTIESNKSTGFVQKFGAKLSTNFLRR